MTNPVEVKQNKPVKEPLVRVVKQVNVPTWKAWLIRLLGVVVALILNAVFISATAKVNPFYAYQTMFTGAFGNKIYIWSTINSAIKLLLIAVALAPAFKMKFWNIGAEGQVLFGLLMSAIVMNKCENLPAGVLFPLMFLAGSLGGALWGVIPAVFKAKWETNETLFTLMMNYIAIQLVSYTYNSWKGDHSSLGQLNKTTKAGWFPSIMGEKTFISVIVVFLFVILMYFYLSKTKQGYEIAVVGESHNTARYAGINVKAVMIRTMAISGFICGMCGFLTLAGESQTIGVNSANGYGFTAIIVAWLAKFNTLYMTVISFLLIALEKGIGLIANRYDSFSDSASQVAIGIVLFCVIGSEFFIRYRLAFRKKEEANV